MKEQTLLELKEERKGEIELLKYIHEKILKQLEYVDNLIKIKFEFGIKEYDDIYDIYDEDDIINELAIVGNERFRSSRSKDRIKEIETKILNIEITN